MAVIDHRPTSNEQLSAQQNQIDWNHKIEQNTKIPNCVTLNVRPDLSQFGHHIMWWCQILEIPLKCYSASSIRIDSFLCECVQDKTKQMTSSALWGMK
jgi:hypothetical protein